MPATEERVVVNNGVRLGGDLNSIVVGEWVVGSDS
jgi:hypothetical protein